MCSFDICYKASKIKWIRHYLDPSVNAVWKSNFEYLCGKQNVSLFLLSNFNESEVCLPIYYMDSLKYWKEIKYELVKTKEDLGSQLVWYNNQFTIDGKTIFSERLFQCGLWTVVDLFNEVGEITSFEIWKTRGALNSDYLIWRAIVTAIPFEWKMYMQNDLNTVICENFGRIVFGDNIKHVTKISEKEVKHYYLKKAYDKLKESDFKAQVKYNKSSNDNDYSPLFQRCIFILSDSILYIQ